MTKLLRERHSDSSLPATNPFNASDVAEILREHRWLAGDSGPEIAAWCERAAALLGPHCEDRAKLSDLLGLIFHYDAGEILQRVESHAALSRHAAREVLRRLALLLLPGGELDSEKFKEIVSALKKDMELRSRDLFHPIRLALAGRAGEGDLDRVILLLDSAALLPFAVSAKSSRVRILQFCAALD